MFLLKLLKKFSDLELRIDKDPLPQFVTHIFEGILSVAPKMGRMRFSELTAFAVMSTCWLRLTRHHGIRFFPYSNHQLLVRFSGEYTQLVDSSR